MSPKAQKKLWRNIILFAVACAGIAAGVVNHDPAASMLGGIALGGLLALNP